MDEEKKEIEKEEKRKEVILAEVEKKPKKIKRFRVTNKNNFPYDLHIGKSCYRLEPRNKIGDSIVIEESLVKHKDMEHVGNKVIIQEAKV